MFGICFKITIMGKKKITIRKKGGEAEMKQNWQFIAKSSFLGSRVH